MRAAKYTLDGSREEQAELAGGRGRLADAADDRLFQDGASGRRRFLDRLVWALEPGHAREVAAHDTAMSGRNRLLAEGRRDAAWLAALEDAMARHAVAAVAARRALAIRLNALLAAGTATGAFPAARIDLACPIAAALAEAPALAVEERLRADLAAGRGRDAAAGRADGRAPDDMTLVHLPKGSRRSCARPGNRRRCWSRPCWPMRR